MKARLLAASLFFLVLLEVLLRFFALRLPPIVANELIRTYTNSVGGIYVFDGETRCNFCLPNHSQLAYVNGFRWQHATDARGLRNPPDCASEVVLIGDSYIYGHGVEESQTVGAILRRQYGWKVYNLARQGDGICQQYVVFRTFIDELKPRKIILFPIVNDFGDAAAMRSDEELQKPPDFSVDYAALRQRLPQLTQVGQPWERLYSYRLLHFLSGFLNRPPARTRYMQVVQDAKLRATLTGYYEKLFADMLARCRRQGIELEMVYIHVDVGDPGWTEAQATMGDILKALCQRHQVPFRSTRQLFHGHPEMTLPGDSHLSPAGHQTLADWLSESVRKEPD